MNSDCLVFNSQSQSLLIFQVQFKIHPKCELFADGIAQFDVWIPKTHLHDILSIQNIPPKIVLVIFLFCLAHLFIFAFVTFAFSVKFKK